VPDTAWSRNSIWASGPLHFVPDDATVVVKAAKRCIPCDPGPPRGLQKLQRLTSLIDFVAE